MARKPKISPVNLGVLVVGFPLVIAAAALFAYFGSRALELPPSHGSRNIGDLIRLIVWTINGTNVVDAGALPAARGCLIAFAVILVVTIAVALREQRRVDIAGKIGADLLDTRWVVRDYSFWQVGDRGGWRDDDGVHTGTIVELHRRPFEFDGATVDAFPSAPGLVLEEDVTSMRAARPLGRLYRLSGSTGPSGTPESIHDDLVAAIRVGDETSWLDPHGDVQEGTILEIKHEPFEVEGKRVDASVAKPGYVMSRTSDGARVGISDTLREGR